MLSLSLSTNPVRVCSSMTHDWLQEDEDSVLMNDPSMFRALSKTQRMAVKHRRQEKVTLRRTIAAVSKAKEKLRLPL